MTIHSATRPGAPILGAVFLLFASACGGSTGGGGGNGGNATTTTPGNGGATSTGSSTTTTTGSTTGTGSGCQGNEATWASLTAGPIACTKSSDCCVIVNGCTNEAQIVSATNKAAAKTAWPYCQDHCTDCIPPAVEVACDNGVCAGRTVPFPDASADLLMDHCGVDMPITITPTKLHFGCGD